MDLASVSFADFEPKASEAAPEGEVSVSVPWPQAKDISLDLSLGQKTLFAADQTPTPTRLIKNCDEVGLFEDLQHVNPFDIGFQRAAEQNVAGTPSCPEAPPPLDGESLHTPQVYPLEGASVTRSDSCGHVDVEQLLASAPTPTPAEPPPLQLIQPQLVTWVLPAQPCPVALAQEEPKRSPPSAARPFILPKPSAGTQKKKRPEPIVVSGSPANTNPEPSSASLTPTSQLPIKERLKAILHSNNLNRRSFSALPVQAVSVVKDPRDRDADSMERRRMAAWRYRNKVRNEHKDLRKLNAQLQQENQELRDRVARLEKELQKLHKQPHLPGPLQLPPASVHLLINVPDFLVPSTLAKK